MYVVSFKAEALVMSVHNNTDDKFCYVGQSSMSSVVSCIWHKCTIAR